MSTHHTTAAQRLAAAEAAHEDRSPAEELRALTQAQFELDGAKFAAVLDARLAGESWSTIGHALGITKQAAQQKYAPTSRRN